MNPFDAWGNCVAGFYQQLADGITSPAIPVHHGRAFPRHPPDAPTRSPRAPTRLPANNSEAAWTPSITAPPPPEYGCVERSTSRGHLRLASSACLPRQYILPRWVLRSVGCPEVWFIRWLEGPAGAIRIILALRAPTWSVLWAHTRFAQSPGVGPAWARCSRNRTNGC